MSNSLVNANLTLSIQDQLVSQAPNAQTFLNRIVPTLSVPSSNLASFSGYLTVPQGSAIGLGVPTGTKVIFCYIRNAGQDPLFVGCTFGNALTVTVGFYLISNGIFLYGNPSLSSAGVVGNTNYITNLIVSSASTSVGGIAEFLVAY